MKTAGSSLPVMLQNRSCQKNCRSERGSVLNKLTHSVHYNRLVKVTDTEGNVTTSVYDMGDRRTEVNHPASGITTFTYDNLGNVLTKQTANLKKEGKTINYEYDYGRLVAINYPNHPENNVKYHYGGINSSYNRIGRLMLREDGSGAIEYYYGNLGEVLKTVRTLIVPNQAVATYVTQWKYDSHNRLLEMIYPDEEKVTYGYNLGGQVEKVSGYKTTHYDYVSKIGYDKFEQRTYLKYCNGAETFYSYDPQRRRLQNLGVNAGGKTIMDNAYSYDAVSNVLGVQNNAPLPQSGKAGGQMSHSYTYDPLYRLSSATGTYKGTDNKTASYTLAMGYDNMHRITSKKQHLTQRNVQFNGTLNAGYDLTYTYNNDEGKKFQLGSVRDINYRTEETPTDSTNINNGHKYTYDANGNLVYINTSRVKHDGKEDDRASEQKYKWDEENRLLAADENGFVSNYWYDADGERTVKTSGENEAIYVNSEFSGGNTGTARFSLYVSPYLVAGQGGKYTKHIYVGSQRIVSKLGDLASYGADPRRIPYAGEADGLTVNYKNKYNQQLQSIKDNYKTFDLPYNGQDNPDYVNGKGFSSNDGTPEAAQARAMVKTRAGDVGTNERMQFYYHPDHLGSSSYITDLDGEVMQHIEYVPFGEVFIEERNNTWNTPYLFNAKELDEETGMYYYGARYYEPRLSLWMSTDRFAEKYPNSTPYAYCLGNPLKFTDINGDTLDVINSRGTYLFTLDNHQANRTNITAKDLYAAGVQWFESSADNYMPLLFVSTNIRESDSFTHFSWDDIISFSEVDRSMLSYRTGGSGDWKAEGNPGNGYLMVEVEGVPYWADAIGQIPFTLNEYRNVLGRTKNSEMAAGETIDMGKRFGNGSLLNIFFPSPDNSNSYDNAIIKRSVDWAKNRYSLKPIRMPNGQYEIGVGKNDYSPNNMRVYIIKKGNRK